MEPIKRVRDDDLIEELHKKILEINSVEEELRSLSQDYEKNFKTFQGLEDPEKLNDTLQSKLVNACSLVENNQEMICLCENHNEIHQIYYSYSEKCKKVRSDIEAFIEQLNFDLKYLYSFQSKRTNTKLWIYDTNSRKSKYANFKIKQKWGRPDFSAQIIELPNSQLFCYEPGCFESYPFIIDARSLKIIKTLPVGPGYWVKGGVYYNNSVFLFGGNNSGTDMDLAIKFNLSQNRWVKIPKLMSPSDSCSYALYKDCIFICGKNHTKLYKFDLNIDSYSEIKIAGAGKLIDKTLVYANSDLYMIADDINQYSIGLCIDWAKNIWGICGFLRLPFFEYSFVKFSKGLIFLWLINKSQRVCYAFNLKESKSEEYSKIEYF